jgi:adenosylhomocysteine nucleosidase
MIRTAIVAAMTGELRSLVKGWTEERRDRVDLWRWRFDTGEWIAACAGAGQSAATRALAAIERGGPVASVISIGWAGGLAERYHPGEAYRVSGVIDTLTGERFRAAPGPAELWLATSPKVADQAEKERLKSAYGAGLVDMEAAAIARLAGMRGIGFHCVKGVSDGVGDRLPDLNRFLNREGRFDLTGMTVYALFHPGYWPALIQMGENSRKASKSIAESVLELLDPHGLVRKRNGYPDFRR